MPKYEPGTFAGPGANVTVVPNLLQQQLLEEQQLHLKQQQQLDDQSQQDQEQDEPREYEVPEFEEQPSSPASEDPYQREFTTET